MENENTNNTTPEVQAQSSISPASDMRTSDTTQNSNTATPATTMSDLLFDPGYCRNISLDIRYCLFIIDKFAGASHLVNEMTIVQ